jgi:hypothetical protein
MRLSRRTIMQLSLQRKETFKKNPTMKKPTAPLETLHCNVSTKCDHVNTTTKVLDHIFICEITVTICDDCGLELDQPKTDC